MGADERAVEERIEVVSRTLEALRARRGPGLTATADEDEAIASLATFRRRVAEDGWTRAFDELVSVVRSFAERAGAAERPQLASMVTYLAGADPAVLRLARAESRKPREGAIDPRSPFLSASRGAPALHPDHVPSKKDGATSPRRGPERQHARTVRDAIEEMGSLSMLRAASPDDAWIVGKKFEERLLECLDATVAYGRGPYAIDVEETALRWAKDYPVVDTGRWFAAAFLMACTEGERAMTRLRRVALEAPEAADAVVDAICLGSNPRCRSVAVSLLDEDDRPHALAIALRCCARLGILDLDAMLALTGHPADAVANEAVRCLARGEALAVAPTLGNLLERPGTAIDAAFVLATFKAEAGPAHLRIAAQRGASAEAGHTERLRARHAIGALAVLGQKRDHDVLASFAAIDDTCIAHLADHGSPDFLPLLLKELASPRTNARAELATRALMRMTGIPFGGPLHLETVLGPRREPFLKQVSEQGLPLGVTRIRRGKAIDTAALWAELAAPLSTRALRYQVAREIALHEGRPLAMDLDDWVSRQETRIAEHHAPGHAPGQAPGQAPGGAPGGAR